MIVLCNRLYLFAGLGYSSLSFLNPAQSSDRLWALRKTLHTSIHHIITIPDFSNKKFTNLTKLIDKEDKNMYNEYSTKVSVKLDSYRLWCFIHGPDSMPPPIPELKKARQTTGHDPNRVIVTVTIENNEAAVEAAKLAALPWYNANKKALSLIIESVPAHKLFLVCHAKFAKEAGTLLRRNIDQQTLFELLA